MEDPSPLTDTTPADERRATPYTPDGTSPTERNGDRRDKPPAAEPPQPPVTVLRVVGTILAWGAVACIITLINRFAGYWFHLPPSGTVLNALLAVPYLLLLLLSLLQIGRAAARTPVSSAFQIVAGAILALPALASLVLFGLVTVRPQLAPLVDTFNVVSASLPIVVQTLVNNFFAPIGLALLGSGLGRILKHPNTLLAGAGFAIFFDIVVVTMGTVAVLFQANSALISAVSVGAGAPPPAPHIHGVPPAPEPLSWVTIGPADVLFMAFFLGGVHRLRIASRATFAWMFALLGAALVIVQTTALSIPALAPMGTAVLVANARHAAFTAQEKRDLKIGVVFALFCATLMVIGARRFLPKPPPSIGFAFKPLSQGNRVRGLLVENIVPKSRAEAGGLHVGDTITAIDGKPFLSEPPQQAVAALATAREQGGVFTVERPGSAKPTRLRLAAAPH